MYCTYVYPRMGYTDVFINATGHFGAHIWIFISFNLVVMGQFIVLSQGFFHHWWFYGVHGCGRVCDCRVGGLIGKKGGLLRNSQYTPLTIQLLQACQAAYLACLTLPSQVKLWPSPAWLGLLRALNLSIVLLWRLKLPDPLSCIRDHTVTTPRSTISTHSIREGLGPRPQ